MAEQDSESELVRVIGGAGDGHFAPAKTVANSELAATDEVYVLRRLRVGGETVKALVLSTITDPIAAMMYRDHTACDAKEAQSLNEVSVNSQ